MLNRKVSRASLRAFGLVALAVVGSLAFAPAAPADIGIPLLPDIPTPSIPGPKELVKGVLDQLFELLFGDIPKKITKSVLQWLLTYPSFGEHTRFDSLRAGGAQVREVAYALAVAFSCAGLVRGLFEDAATAAVETVRKLLFVIAAITLWPWVFDLAVRLSNAATEMLLEVPEISTRTTALLGFAFLTGAATGIGFICGFIAAVLLIGLFLEKVLALSGLTVLYVLGPVLLAAYPFPPTSHLIGIGGAALTALLVINPVWTGLLVVFALVAEGALTVGAAAVEDFLEPVISVAMLLLVVAALPLLVRLAWSRGLVAALMTPSMGGAGGGGGAWAAAGAARTVMATRASLERSSSRQLAASAWLAGPAAPAAAIAGGAAVTHLPGGQAASAAGSAAGAPAGPTATAAAAPAQHAQPSPAGGATSERGQAGQLQLPGRLFPDSGPLPPFMGGGQALPPPFMGGEQDDRDGGST